LESGDRASLSIEVGDIVIYGKFGGMDMEVNGEDVKILRESEILAKVL
jgi:chaperonin GroES